MSKAPVQQDRSIGPLLERGMRAHQEGKTAEAQKLYEQVLALDGDQPQATHLLGALAAQAGDQERALELMRRAAALAPGVAGFHYNLGQLLARLGRWAEAITAYRRALQVQGAYPEAMFALAGAYKQTGQTEEMVAALRQGLDQRPQFAEGWSILGIALADRGDVEGGIETLRRAVALNPEDKFSWGNLGVLLRRTGQYEQAIEACCQALSYDPNQTGALTNLGLSQIQLQKFEEAVVALEQVVRLQPNEPEALSNLGYALALRKSFERAVTLYRRVIELRPGDSGAWSNLGNALREVGQVEEAIAACRKAVELNPNGGDGWCNLGGALQEADRPVEALAALEKARAIMPDSPPVLTNLSNCLTDLDRAEQGVSALRRALEIEPGDALAHWLLAMRLMRLAEYAEGFKEYEWRFVASQPQQRPRHAHRPRWQGEDLAGERILIHSEQGYGDAIQFVRFAKEVARRGGKVILEAQPALLRLIATAPGLGALIAVGDRAGEFAVQCPLLSLPLALKMTAATIPGEVPYLHADAQTVAHWGERLGKLPQRLKVGINWAGNAEFKNDPRRSTKLATFAPLAEVAAAHDIALISLRKGGGAVTQAPEGMNLIDYTAELSDFADTAALIENLDLVISTDTSVPHLAGALGKKVWLLISSSADWRWLIGREESPWYPTMRIFRQKKLGDWSEPMQAVAAALEKFAQAHQAGGGS